MNDITDLIKWLKEAEVNAHFWHLITTDYPQHMALGRFYEEITDKIDALAETYQGKYGTRIEMPQTLDLTPFSNMKDWFSEGTLMLDQWIDQWGDDLVIQDLIIDLAHHHNTVRYLLSLK